MQLNRRAHLMAVLAFAGAVGLAACGSDDDQPAVAGDDEETIEVRGIDYAFEGIPATVEAGTTLTFTNASEVEPHELVLFRIPDGEDRSIDELLALPEEEAERAVGAPIGVAVAVQPGSAGELVEGDLTVSEPGRYVALCFLPVGSDPDEMQEMMESDAEGPPEQGADAGPPHFVQGMKHEFTVE